jgi:hypothetical protein
MPVVAAEGEYEHKCGGNDEKGRPAITPSTSPSAPTRFLDERLQDVDVRRFLGKRRTWCRRGCRHGHADTPDRVKLL